MTRLFKETVFPLRYAPTIRNLTSKLKDLSLLEVMSKKIGPGERFDVFGTTYEQLFSVHRVTK